VNRGATIAAFSACGVAGVAAVDGTTIAPGTTTLPPTATEPTATPSPSEPNAGIHGTPGAASIGYSASHGCIGMLIPEVEWPFNQVDRGTPVFIVAA